ncbi:hypothetical protein ABID99_005490 [Mucilaginibacter sp. OAE612]
MFCVFTLKKWDTLIFAKTGGVLFSFFRGESKNWDPRFFTYI